MKKFWNNLGSVFAASVIVGGLWGYIYFQWCACRAVGDSIAYCVFWQWW